MSEDYWDDIDDFDHNEINYILKGSGVDENQPLTKQIISTIFGVDRVNSELDGRLLLDDLEVKLKNSAQPKIAEIRTIY